MHQLARIIGGQDQMLDKVDISLEAGVRNMIFACGGCRPGHRLLIVHETEDDGYFDPHLAPEFARIAGELGLETQCVGVPLYREVADLDDWLIDLIEAADCTIFFARLGDQIRFRPDGASKRQIVSYALDRDMLASSFGSVTYGAFEELKHLVNRAMSAAKDVHVTCPLGTDFRGRLSNPLTAQGEVTRKRFHVSVFTPVSARDFSGRIAQAGFLTGPGSNYSHPDSRGLCDVVYVSFDANRITGFDGCPNDVAAARAQYEFVGQTLGIDTYFVHSWHVGIHPGCHYGQTAAQNLERWSGGAFGNPRLLHFHTCGAYAPGEISLNVLDPTVCLDGVALWLNGVLRPDVLEGGPELLDRYPDMKALFETPSSAAGQGPDGRLSYH